MRIRLGRRSTPSTDLSCTSCIERSGRYLPQGGSRTASAADGGTLRGFDAFGLRVWMTKSPAPSDVCRSKSRSLMQGSQLHPNQQVGRRTMPTNAMTMAWNGRGVRPKSSHLSQPSQFVSDPWRISRQVSATSRAPSVSEAAGWDRRSDGDNRMSDPVAVLCIACRKQAEPLSVPA